MNPDLLYKYHKINSHLEEIIKSSRIWFSHQNELNDPYDCKYSISDDFLMSLFKRASETLVSDLNENTNIHDRINKRILPSLRTEKGMQFIYNMLFGERLGWSACCFTTDPLNELMWAFYGDNYKGVCLEFDFSKTILLQEKLNQVKYTDTLPELCKIDDLVEILRTKKTIWSFEREWRLVSKTNGHVPFNKESLTGIIFGFNSSLNDIENVLKLLIDNGFTKIKIKQIKFRIKGVTLENIDFNM